MLSQKMALKSCVGCCGGREDGSQVGCRLSWRRRWCRVGRFGTGRRSKGKGEEGRGGEGGVCSQAPCFSGMVSSVIFTLAGVATLQKVRGVIENCFFAFSLFCFSQKYELLSKAVFALLFFFRFSSVFVCFFFVFVSRGGG